jgi:hypothetical protein
MQMRYHYDCLRERSSGLKFRVFWDIMPCSQIDVDRRLRCACCLHHQGDTEAARTSETSVDIDLTTWQYIPEDSELHTRRRENLNLTSSGVFLEFYRIKVSGKEI